MILLLLLAAWRRTRQGSGVLPMSGKDTTVTTTTTAAGWREFDTHPAQLPFPRSRFLTLLTLPSHLIVPLPSRPASQGGMRSIGLAGGFFFRPWYLIQRSAASWPMTATISCGRGGSDLR